MDIGWGWHLIQSLDFFCIFWRMLIFVLAGSQINSWKLTLYLCSLGSTFVMVSLRFLIIIRVNALILAESSKMWPLWDFSGQSKTFTHAPLNLWKSYYKSYLSWSRQQLKYLPFSSCLWAVAFCWTLWEFHLVALQYGGHPKIWGDFISRFRGFPLCRSLLSGYSPSISSCSGSWSELHPLISFFFFFNYSCHDVYDIPGTIYNCESVPFDHLYPFFPVLH